MDLDLHRLQYIHFQYKCICVLDSITHLRWFRKFFCCLFKTDMISGSISNSNFFLFKISSNMVSFSSIFPTMKVVSSFTASLGSPTSFNSASSWLVSISSFHFTGGGGGGLLAPRPRPRPRPRPDSPEDTELPLPRPRPRPRLGGGSMGGFIKLEDWFWLISRNVTLFEAGPGGGGGPMLLAEAVGGCGAILYEDWCGAKYTVLALVSCTDLEADLDPAWPREWRVTSVSAASSSLESEVARGCWPDAVKSSSSGDDPLMRLLTFYCIVRGRFSRYCLWVLSGFCVTLPFDENFLKSFSKVKLFLSGLSVIQLLQSWEKS